MGRLAMIDGIRGLGALSIATYHIFRYGPLPEAAETILPEPVRIVIAHSWMAVQWFFVIAGFGAALVTNEQPIRIATVRPFILRRVLRLGPTYWSSIALTAGLTMLAIYGWNDRTLNDEHPTWPQLLAHMAFLQDVLGHDSLTTGIWFVAIDLQLGIAFVLLLAIAQGTTDWFSRTFRFSAEGALVFWFGPLTLWSLFVSVRESSTDMWFHHFLCFYMLGVLLGWTIVGRTSALLFWLYVAAMLGQLSWQFSKEIAVALTAGLTIYGCWLGRRLDRWLTWPVLQYLGRISYSLFLIHYPTSWLVGRLGYRLTGDQPAAAFGWLMVALAASIGVAHLLYIVVERPAAAWARHSGRKARSNDSISPPRTAT